MSWKGQSEHYCFLRDEVIKTGLLEETEEHAISWTRILLDNDGEIMEVIRHFKLDTLVETVWKNAQNFRSSLIEFDDSLFFDFVIANEVDNELERVEVALIIKPGQILTIEHAKSRLFDNMIAQIDLKKMKKFYNEHYLAYKMLRYALTNVQELIEAIEDSVDEVETQILENRRSGDDIASLYTFTSLVNGVHRMTQPWPRVLSRYADATEDLVEIEFGKFLDELANRAYRIHSQAENLVVKVKQLRDQNLSFQNERMTRTMQMLTIVSTLFIPMTFLAGIYGMNFKHMPELAFKWSYPLFWLAIVIIAMIMLMVFRRKRWI